MIGQIGQQYFLPQGQWDFMSIVEKCPNAFVDVLQQPSVHLAERRQIHRILVRCETSGAASFA